MQSLPFFRPLPIRTLVACAALALPGTALAQDQTQDQAQEPAQQVPEDQPAPDTSPAPEQAPAETADDTPTDAPEAPLATDALVDPADPDDAETYVAATHRDWQILCSRLGENQPDLCEMYQLLETEEGPIAEISIRALPEEAGFPAGVTITTPLETFLPPGVSFRVDAGQPRQEPFFVCTVIGCIARLGLQAAEVTAMQRGASAFLTISSIAAVEEPIEIPVSLMGFTAALEDLQARMPTE